MGMGWGEKIGNEIFSMQTEKISLETIGREK